jgi:hypothetical protein
MTNPKREKKCNVVGILGDKEKILIRMRDQGERNK